ncbi:MAG: MATE family efflux transporter, partial [Paenibacillus sp.]|nr:MATE family efflux transporter [Paenibacillus sp.]
ISGMTTLFTGIFQATAQGTAAFIMSIIQGATLIPVLFIANEMNGFHGAVWSLVIADAVAFLVGASMLYILRNKLQPPELESLVH